MNIETQIAKFEAFVSERLPVLHEFSKSLGFTNPHEILLNPEAFVDGLDSWLSEQNVSKENENWLAIRIGYFIGEYFVVKFGGCWSVCEAKESRYYGHYIVGEFDAFNNPNALFDPVGASVELVRSSPGRSLKKLISEIEVTLGAL